MTTMTVKGQVTIPKKFRERLGLTPGCEVEFVDGPGGEVVVKAARAPADDIDAALDRVTGIMKLGMSTDEYMKLLRGDDDTDLL